MALDTHCIYRGPWVLFLALVLLVSFVTGRDWILNAESLLGFSVWALMQSIGEVTTMFPIAGGFIEVRSNHRLVTVISTLLKNPLCSTLDASWTLPLAFLWPGCII